MLKNLFSWRRDRKVLPEELTYQEAKDALESHSNQVRRELAGREEVEPEILYYLAEDGSADVRALVAANPNAPQQANLILADDEDEEVRCELAAKISRLIPHMSEKRNSENTRSGARSYLETGKQIIWRAFVKSWRKRSKHSQLVPQHIVKKMAFDLEEIVCIPIIQYSPLLSDLDLLEIISRAHVDGAVTAVCQPFLR